MSLSLGTAPEVNSKTCQATPREQFQKGAEKASMLTLKKKNQCTASSPTREPRFGGTFGYKSEGEWGLGVKASVAVREG